MTEFGLLLALALAGALLFLRWREPNMIYLPSRGIDATPASRGWDFEDVFLETADGVRIHGWWLPAAVGDGPAVLFLHGNAGNISHRFEKLEVLRQLGAAVLIADYRGYGRSAGRPDEGGTYRDADAAYAHLVGDRGIAPRRIVAYGESLGAAVAVDLASRVELGGLILEGAFTSVPDVAARLYPFLPVRPLVRNRYDSVAKVGRVRAPILLLQAAQDEFFGAEHANALRAAAQAPVDLVSLQGGHNDAFATSAGAYRDALAVFLSRVGGLPASPPAR